MTLKRAPIAGVFALALVSPEQGAATTLYLEATGGLHRPFDQDAWGGRAATLFDRIGVSNVEAVRPLALGASVQWVPAPSFHAGLGYRHLTGTLDVGVPGISQTHETTVHAGLAELRLYTRAGAFVAFGGAALGLGYTSVEARGHLGTDRVTDMNLAAAVTAGGGLMLGTFDLLLMVEAPFFQTPPLRSTYYAQGGETSGLTLSFGLGKRFEVY
jgi:hypothetical protein